MTGSPLLARLSQAGFVVACAVAWSVASDRHLVNPLLLPSFTRVMSDLGELLRQGAYVSDLLVTLRELFIAFAIASALGLLTGYFVGRSRFLSRAFEPLIGGLYSVPTILLFPLFVLYFGIGQGSKIAMGSTIAFFPIALTTIAGLANVDAGLVRAARSMGATNWSLFWSVMLPAALPVIAGGLRLGLILALLAILGGETIASIDGLGRRIVDAADSMETSKMFAYTLLALAMAICLNAAVTAAERFARSRMG